MTTRVREQLIDDVRFLGGIFLEMENGYKAADYTEDLAALMPQLRIDHGHMFSGEHDSAGNRWAPLAKSTVNRKGHESILWETGHLEASLVQEGGDHHEDVGSRSFKFGTFNEIAEFHQRGTKRMPARPPVGFQEETLDRIVNEVADAAVETLKGP